MAALSAILFSRDPNVPTPAPKPSRHPPAAAVRCTGLLNYPIPPRCRHSVPPPRYISLQPLTSLAAAPGSPPIVPAPAPSPPSHCPRPRSPRSPPPSSADRTARAPQASPCTQTIGPLPARPCHPRPQLPAPATVSTSMHHRLSAPGLQSMSPLPPPRKASQSPPPPRRPRRHGPRTPGGNQPAPGPGTPAQSGPEKRRGEDGSGRGMRARIRPAGAALLTDSCSIRVHFRAAHTR